MATTTHNGEDEAASEISDDTVTAIMDFALSPPRYATSRRTDAKLAPLKATIAELVYNQEMGTDRLNSEGLVDQTAALSGTNGIRTSTTSHQVSTSRPAMPPEPGNFWRWL